ncbi:hypothetical protein IV203_008040 [Nitzschia inconspicua]|uniref:Uncharacterized protein n=1 Tax=Nitzschia inconspicua TaxID=303405 RepID=A0A9K3KY06_9STRA|nr:hypothetical protein IV203_008040 [Nitzschia inconspicua]
MTSEFSNPTIQTLGIRAIEDCYYLRHFSPHALEVIIATVLNHSTSTSLLQIQGNYALRVFARTKFPRSNITKVFSSMAEVLVSHLFRILVLHSDSNHLKLSSLRLLHVLGSSFPTALRAISSDKDNSVGLLLSLLSFHKGIGRIAMSLLSFVAENNEGRDAILGHEGVEKVMQTMKACLDDPLLLCNGTAVLSWVLLSKPSTEGTFFHPFNYDSVDTLCDILGRHLEDGCLFGNTICALVGYLTYNGGIVERYWKKTLPILLQGLAVHKQTRKVARCCLRLLRILTMDCSSCQNAVLHHHLEAIDSTMQHFITDDRMQEEAIGILGNICVSISSQETLCQSVVIETVLKCQENGPTNPRLRQVTLWFHNQLLHYSNASKADFSFGGTHENLQALMHHRLTMQ